MKDKHQSHAAKARWAKLSPEERSKAMKKIRRKLSPTAPDEAIDKPVCEE
jgi:acyl-CoA reductase-like NAD-dependent aldehyde dehydrogenase